VTTRWLFGDQLGPHFTDDHDGARVTYLRSGTYREALAQVDGPLQVMKPTSFAALRFVEQPARERPVELLPARGFLTTRDEFEQ
jgi:deoxyribodipyrimidine photolyase-related protein